VSDRKLILPGDTARTGGLTIHVPSGYEDERDAAQQPGALVCHVIVDHDKRLMCGKIFGPEERGKFEKHTGDCARKHLDEIRKAGIAQAILDGEAALHRLGGVLTIVVGRHPTDLPGEMVTTSALIEWKDRTDARPQPETPGDPVPEQAAPPAREPEPVGADVLPPPADAAAFAELPEEDDSSIEPALRA
jgi:hypothetical protein